MNYLLILQAVADVTKPALELSKGISEYGILVIMAAFFILIAVIQMWTNNKRYNSIMDQNNKRYEDLFNKFTSGLDTGTLSKEINELIASINSLVAPVGSLLEAAKESAKEECSYAQITRVIKVEVRITKLSLMESIKVIVEKNNVHEDESKTKDKIAKVVNNSMASLRQGINLFKYKGGLVTQAIKQQYTDSLIDTCNSFVLGDNRDFTKFSNDLEVIFEDMKAVMLDITNH